MATLRSSKPLTQQGVSKFNPPLQLAGEKTSAGNGPTNGFSCEGPSTRLTQKDQDNTDEENYRESLRSLIQTWMDNLELISVLTTFFVSTEASLLAITLPSPTDPGLSITSQLANIGLMSALVIHANAAIISFFSAFFLVRHKLDVAQEEEEEAEMELVDSPTSIPSNDAEKSRGSQTYANGVRTGSGVRGRVRVNSPLSGDQIIYSTNPRLVHVGPFRNGQPPTELLSRCRSLCIFLSFVGFLFALIGALSFAWGRLPRSVSIFASVTTSLCVVAAFLIIITPSTKTSHIYSDRKHH
ncbi:hypothetical protein BYT27DRAFT_7126188 [Phlegmacium glaucopus]|nr:hypothetical protein BYT27DRAFT_7126188 [Phlegmacium glaucopus]